MDLAIFCDSLCAWGLLVGYLTLQIVELHCNLPLCGALLLFTLHPYVIVCGVDKQLSKLAGNSASYVLWRE